MSKLKIVFVLSRFSRGGAEKNVLFIISNLDRQFFEIHLILFNYSVKDYNIPNDVNVVVLNRSLLFGVWKLRSEILFLGPNVLFSTVSHFNIFIAINRLLLLPSNIKYIAREANMLSLLNKD